MSYDFQSEVRSGFSAEFTTPLGQAHTIELVWHRGTEVWHARNRTARMYYKAAGELRRYASVRTAAREVEELLTGFGFRRNSSWTELVPGLERKHAQPETCLQGQVPAAPAV